MEARPAVDSREDATRRVRLFELYREAQAKHLPGAPAIDVEEFQTRLASDEPVVLDVRGRRERRVSILPGAVDLDAFEQMRDSLGDRPVIVYCTIGHRSGEATQRLRAEGVEAFNLAGGILAWAHAGGEVLDGRSGEPTRRVHVYGRRWSLLPEGWRPVFW